MSSYLEFFQLHSAPFSEKPDVRYFFDAPSQQGQFERVVSALKSYSGVICIAGAEGVGKTLLVERVAQQMDEVFHFTFLQASNIHASQVIIQQSKPAVLVVDQADQLSAADILWLKKCAPTMRIILVARKIGVVASYFSVSCFIRLAALKSSEVGAYCAHRLSVAGCTSNTLIPHAVIPRLAYYSKRRPQRVNQILSEALLFAYKNGYHCVNMPSLIHGLSSVQKADTAQQIRTQCYALGVFALVTVMIAYCCKYYLA